MSDSFWNEAKKYRAIMQIMVAGFIPFGMVVTYVWIKMFEFNFNFIVPFIGLLLWYLFYLRVVNKFKSLVCPKCGELAFGDSPNILTKMNCIECGLRNE